MCYMHTVNTFNRQEERRRWGQMKLQQFFVALEMDTLQEKFDLILALLQLNNHCDLVVSLFCCKFAIWILLTAVLAHRFWLFSTPFCISISGVLMGFPTISWSRSLRTHALTLRLHKLGQDASWGLFSRHLLGIKDVKSLAHCYYKTPPSLKTYPPGITSPSDGPHRG